MQNIVENYSNKEYRVAGEMDIPKARKTFFTDPIIQLNQNFLDPYGCGYMAGIGALSDLLGLGKTSARLIASEANKKKEEYGYMEGIGMYSNKSIDLVRDVANNKLKLDFLSLRLKIGSTKMYEMLGKGYSIMTGYRGNKKYNEDKNDGLLEGVEFGEATYGHMIRLVQYKSDIYVIDNYNNLELDKIDIEEYSKQNKNIYKVGNLEKLIENDVFFNYGFIFIVKQDMDKQEKNIYYVKQAYRLGLTDNIQNIRDIEKGNYTKSVQMALMNARNIAITAREMGKSIEDIKPLNS